MLTPFLFVTALVAFHQQILTPQSKLPLAITDPTVLIIQHYFDVSPTLDEVFNAWQEGDKVG
jgi:nucleolar pre-ribosomal-associated protein 1